MNGDGDEDEVTGSDPASRGPEPEPVPLLPDPDPNAPRHKAALILARLFSASFLMIIAAEMIDALYWGKATSDEVTTLMLTIGSLLVGVTGGYLSRNLNAPPKNRPELETKVGVLLAKTLGGMLLILATADLLETMFSDAEISLSSNALNILAVLMSGIIGALGGYLGLSSSGNKDGTK